MRIPRGRNIVYALAAGALAGLAIVSGAGVMLAYANNGRLWSRPPQNQAAAAMPEASPTATASPELRGPTLPPSWTPSATPTGYPTSTPTATPTSTQVPTPTSTKVPTPTNTRVPVPTYTRIPAGYTSGTGCPSTSAALFGTAPILGPPLDRPAQRYAELNMEMRGYVTTFEERTLVDYPGAVDPNAPRFSGLFEPNRLPVIRNTYRVYRWNFEPEACGGSADGCRGPEEGSYRVTMVGFATTPGEEIRIPERALQIYPGGSRALVLYAEERRITLAYTLEDTVANGYVVYVENVCVDPELLALYEAQTDAEGRHSTGYLPVLRNEQALGTAYGTEIQVAIRDSGKFMDPRSAKDWWQDM